MIYSISTNQTIFLYLAQQQQPFLEFKLVCSRLTWALLFDVMYVFMYVCRLLFLWLQHSATIDAVLSSCWNFLNDRTKRRIYEHEPVAWKLYQNVI